MSYIYVIQRGALDLHGTMQQYADDCTGARKESWCLLIHAGASASLPLSVLLSRSSVLFRSDLFGVQVAQHTNGFLHAQRRHAGANTRSLFRSTTAPSDRTLCGFQENS